MTKKYRKPQPTRTLNKKERPQTAKPTIDKKWFQVGAVALVAVILLTIGLIWFYSEPVVARADGIRVRESDVINEFVNNAGLQQLTTQFGMSWEATREETVRQIVLAQLFEDFARRNNIELERNQFTQAVRGTVTQAVVADASLFANFESYMPEDPIPPAQARADELHARAIAGEDFATLIATYGEDPGMETSPEGYVFIEGVMVTEFFEATRNLAIGEISEPVQSTHGFHIIKRVEVPEDALVRIPGNQQVSQPLTTDDEVLGAVHILIAARATTHEERMTEAVNAKFLAQLETINLEFLSALEDIQQPWS